MEIKRFLNFKFFFSCVIVYYFFNIVSRYFCVKNDDSLFWSSICSIFSIFELYYIIIGGEKIYLLKGTKRKGWKL